MRSSTSRVAARASVCATALFVLGSIARASHAQTVVAPGYIHSFVTLPDTTQSCVASARGGTFVGMGPGFTGAGQSVVFVDGAGGVRTVVSGLNSIGDCAYDPAGDVLYITDNALEAAGAVTGDTIFAVAHASTAEGLSALGLEAAPAGSIPNAASVAINAAGEVFISDAAGGGAGSVYRLSAGVLGAFIPSSFDFTAGLLVEPDGNLLVAETLDTFETQIRRFDATGAFVNTVSGPGFEHGSFDLARNRDGRVLATGAFAGPIAAIDPVTGEVASFAEGFSFATSIDVESFTGRVELVSSTFVPDEEDFRLHFLTPVAELAADGAGRLRGRRATRECVSEFYGVKPAMNVRGKFTGKMRCTDGDTCDADGTADGVCRFRFGLCVNVADARMPDCASDAVTSVELKKSKPASAAASAIAAAAGAALPIEGPACFFSEGIAVPVRVTKQGKEKDGKQLVKFKTRSEAPRKRTDVDKIKLVCAPA